MISPDLERIIETEPTANAPEHVLIYLTNNSASHTEISNKCKMEVHLETVLISFS